MKFLLALLRRESFRAYQLLNRDIKGSREASTSLMGISGATLEYQTDESLPIVIKPDERCNIGREFHNKP